jgi:hypothetical protein
VCTNPDTFSHLQSNCERDTYETILDNTTIWYITKNANYGWKKKKVGSVQYINQYNETLIRNEKNAEKQKQNKKIYHHQKLYL